MARSAGGGCLQTKTPDLSLTKDALYHYVSRLPLRHAREERARHLPHSVVEDFPTPRPVLHRAKPAGIDIAPGPDKLTVEKGATVGNLRVIEGDFVQHPETGYGWGRVTVYGWKHGEKSPSRFSLVVADEAAAFKLKGSEAISQGGATAAGAAQGAMSGLGAGPIGIIGGVVLGAIIGAAAAESHNEKARGDNQRFELTFADGRRLVAEGHVRTVLEIQDKAMQALTKRAKQ